MRLWGVPAGGGGRPDLTYLREETLCNRDVRLRGVPAGGGGRPDLTYLREETLCNRDVRLRGVPAGGGGRPNDLRPQRPQRRHLLIGHLFRHHDDAPEQFGMNDGRIFS